MRCLTGIAALAFALPLATPGTAEAAGTYEIQVCAGGANRAWTPSASQRMFAGPAPTKCAGGLVVRHEIGPDGTRVGTGAAARFGMKAPSGTQIVRAVVSGRFDTRGKNWQAVLSNGSKVLLGCPAGRDSCIETPQNAFVPMPPSDALYVEALCTNGPCNAFRHPDAGSDHAYARARLGGVTMTIRDPTPPVLTNVTGSAWTGAWIGGQRSVTFDASDGSGVRSVYAVVDETIVSQASKRCGSFVYKCRDFKGVSLDVDLTRLSDGGHTLFAGARDRASNGGVAGQQINVDNTPPTPPINLGTNVTRGWSSTPGVRLAWSNPAQQFAPIEGATVRACPAGGGGGCVTRDYSGSGISAVDYELPGDGAWDISVWLRDAAGNSSSGQASSPLRIGLDREAPSEVAFRPLNPRNPSIVRVHAVDRLSGLARGEIQVRRKGRKSWRSVRTRLVADGLRAQLPDAQLRNGRYALRARVVDVAGNERTTGRRLDGSRAAVRLPVRVAARMRVGRKKKVRAKRAGSRKRHLKIVYVKRPVIRAGKRMRVGGRLVAPGGNPLAGVKVDVAARPEDPDARFKPVATLRTSKRGRFAYSLPPGRSRYVRFTYRGAKRIRPQQRTVHVRVRAATSIRVSDREVVNGESVVFTGKVRTGPQPPTGKLIALQFYDRGEWRTFRNFHADPESGRWRYEYRFTETSGQQTYKLRAQLTRESGYGYAAGASRPVKVTVKGL